MTNKKAEKPQETSKTGLSWQSASNGILSVAQQAADRECKHPQQGRLRPDEPMHPYGLD